MHTSTLPYILPGQDHLHLLPGGVCGHLLIDKVLQLLMQACHEVCTWRVEGNKDWDKFTYTNPRVRIYRKGITHNIGPFLIAEFAFRTFESNCIFNYCVVSIGVGY